MGQLIRGITKEKNARLFCVDTKDVVQKAKDIHNTSLTATAALGRLLTAALMMGVDLKDENSMLTIKIDGDGPVRKIIVTADNNGKVKGDIYNPEVELPLNEKGKLDVASLIGNGNMTVIKDFGMKHPYSGVSPIVSGEIGEDISYYFYHSEQIPSVVGLGVFASPNEVLSAGGFIIQLLPEAKEEFIDKLENKMSEINSVTELFNTMTPKEVLEHIMKNVEEFEITEEMDTEYYCNCDKDKFYRALITLGKDEITKLFEKEDKFETECHFCKKKYQFEKKDFNDFI